MLADHIIVTTDGDHTSVEVIVGLIHTYRRDMQCSNNSVMDTIIICPGGCGRGDGQTVFRSIEVKRIFAKKGTKKSLEKKRASEKGILNGNYALCIFLHYYAYA